MPSRTYDDETWQRALDAYEAWDPDGPEGLRIEDVLEPFGISKQSFYAYRRKMGLGNKTNKGTAMKPESAAVLEALVTATLRIRVLEEALTNAGVPIPERRG